MHIWVEVLFVLVFLGIVWGSSHLVIASFAKRWRLDRSTAKRLYRRKQSLSTCATTFLVIWPLAVLSGLAGSVVFTHDLTLLTGLVPWLVYGVPLIYLITGSNLVLMSAGELAYAHHRNRLTAVDLPKGYTTADLEATLLAAPPVSTRLIRTIGWISIGLAVLALYGVKAGHVVETWNRISALPATAEHP